MAKPWRRRSPCFRAGGDAGDHVGEDAQRVGDRVDGVEQRFLVFLVVLVVGERLAFIRVSSAVRWPYAAGLAAREFGDVRVLLLRHDRLPVQKRSAILTKPKRGFIHSTSSSDMREKCIIKSAAAAQNSIAKSRSETASSEFSQTPSKPSSAATNSRSIG